MGILDFMQSDPNATQTPQGGILGPLRGDQKTAMLFAGLRDAVGAFGGQTTNNLQGVGQSIQGQNIQARRAALNAEIQKAIGEGNMQKVRQLLAGADPETAKHITDVLKVGTTEYSTTPNFAADGSSFVIGKDASIKQLPVNIAPDPNKPFNIGQGGAPVPNLPYQKYEMGKSRAGATNVTVNADKTLATSLAGGVGDILKASQGTATGALQTIDTANQIKTAIDSGKVMAGPTTSWRMAAQQLFGGDQETLNQTRSTIQGLAKLSLAGRSALKGQGQISDFEGKLLQRATSGDIDSMTVGEIRTITNIAERAARAQIKAHSNTLGRVTKTLDPGMASMLDVYRVDEPAAPQPAAVPSGIDPKLWQHMTPEERALWR